MAHAIKHNHKLTNNPPLNLIAVADKHFLPLLDNENDNDANPADLMGKYDGGGKKKGGGEHSRMYRNNDKIEALRGLYE